jgi:hypothetical protein
VGVDEAPIAREDLLEAAAQLRALPRTEREADDDVVAVEARDASSSNRTTA